MHCKNFLGSLPNSTVSGVLTRYKDIWDIPFHHGYVSEGSPLWIRDTTPG
jgi:hypothetical protein